MNTGDMVQAFRKIPGSQTLKTSDWTDSSLKVLLDRCCELGKTTVMDLVGLVVSTFNYQPATILKTEFDYLLQIQRSGDTKRASSFLDPPLNCFGKSGSLGYRFISNDCGVFFDSGRACPLVAFGYSMAGLSLIHI